MAGQAQALDHLPELRYSNTVNSGPFLMAGESPLSFGATTSLSATSTTGNAALPTKTSNQIVITNLGPDLAYVALGADNTVTATTASYPLLPGTQIAVSCSPSILYGAAITASTTATIKFTAADGYISGVGAASTGASGGIGEAVTIADGADVAQGAKADAAWTTGSGSVVSILKAVDRDVLAGNLPLGTGTPAAAGRIVSALGSTGAQTIVAASASDGTILAANVSRIGFSVFNDSATATLYLLLATGTSSVTVYSVQLAPGSFFANSTYAGVVKGIWSAASGNARVTENT